MGIDETKLEKMWVRILELEKDGIANNVRRDDIVKKIQRIIEEEYGRC